MKRILIVTISALFFACLTSCLEESCKTCRIVTRDSNGAIVSEDAAAEYCGTDLVDKELDPPVVIGDNTSKWECE